MMELARETQFPSADKKVSDERSADAAEKDKDVEEEAGIKGQKKRRRLSAKEDKTSSSF